MDGMHNTPDKFYDLAIVDPPYGNFKDSMTRTGGTWNKKYYAEGENHCKTINWDYAPTKEYFDELFRVSKEQIIWGGNYFGLPPNRCFLIWRKLTISESFSMAMCEYAWASFNENSKLIEIAPQNSNRFHPTQKPEKLYAWILRNYAKEGNKILDTHLGSGSIAIACYDMGYDLTGYEIDKDYFEKASKRLEDRKKQLTMF
jgi:site-specific DNA-methyltransferase (adenine-specific)